MGSWVYPTSRRLHGKLSLTCRVDTIIFLSIQVSYLFFIWGWTYISVVDNVTILTMNFSFCCVLTVLPFFIVSICYLWVVGLVGMVFKVFGNDLHEFKLLKILKSVSFTLINILWSKHRMMILAVSLDSKYRFWTSSMVILDSKPLYVTLAS